MEQILNLLQSDTFYGQSELIEIAKGKYKFYTDYKNIKEQHKRAQKWQSEKR